MGAKIDPFVLNPLIMKHVRSIKKWSQGQLARELGVGRACIGRWETGENKMHKIHELALRTLVGDVDYYIAAQRTARGTAPTFRMFRGFV